MDAYHFTTDLINSGTILDFETYTDRVIAAAYPTESANADFKSMMDDLKSFEGGNNMKFCINFTGAWLKYALDGVYDKKNTQFVQIDK